MNFIQSSAGSNHQSNNKAHKSSASSNSSSSAISPVDVASAPSYAISTVDAAVADRNFEAACLPQDAIVDTQEDQNGENSKIRNRNDAANIKVYYQPYTMMISRKY